MTSLHLSSRSQRLLGVDVVKGCLFAIFIIPALYAYFLYHYPYFFNRFFTLVHICMVRRSPGPIYIEIHRAEPMFNLHAIKPLERTKPRPVANRATRTSGLVSRTQREVGKTANQKQGHMSSSERKNN